MRTTKKQRSTEEAMPKETRDVQTQNNEARSLPEQLRSGPVYTPAVDIFESDAAITVLADLPGVKPKDLRIDLRENVLTLTGRVDPPEANETVVLREYDSGTFYRQFTLAETIDQGKIDASLVHGVLRLVLPKVEGAKPRRIAVKSQ
jgi:HSP20 family molecular chaperone IbpA